MLKLGDIAERCLGACGITKQRVQAFTGMADCGCEKRQESFNQFGYGLQARFANVRYRLRYTWQTLRYNAFTARLETYWRLQVMAFRALFHRR
jgi:hypothetical protein